MREVVEAVASRLERDYVLEERAWALAARLREALARGEYDGLEGPDLAERVTADLRAVCGDGHLGLEWSADVLPEAEEPTGIDERDVERWYGPHLNYGFEKVERVEGNVGLLDLRVFAPVSIAADVAAAAMTLLAQSTALVVDLRKNGGGDDKMVALLAAYLFDEPVELSGVYDRLTGTTTPTSTPAEVPGRRFGGTKPVSVLTSRRTFSAAEQFAYDLQALGRATIVGEPTGGGAHPYENCRVDPHFMLALVRKRSVNPITGGNWQGVGVQPDVAVNAEGARDEALRRLRAGT